MATTESNDLVAEITQLPVQPGAAMRLLWEDAIRALLCDSAATVPVVTDVTLPDARLPTKWTAKKNTFSRQNLPVHSVPTPCKNSNHAFSRLTTLWALVQNATA